MHRIFRVKAYEKEHGPHFNKESKSNGSSAYERDVTIGYERCNE